MHLQLFLTWDACCLIFLICMHTGRLFYTVQVSCQLWVWFFQVKKGNFIWSQLTFFFLHRCIYVFTAGYNYICLEVLIFSVNTPCVCACVCVHLWCQLASKHSRIWSSCRLQLMCSCYVFYCLGHLTTYHMKIVFKLLSYLLLYIVNFIFRKDVMRRTFV